MKLSYAQFLGLVYHDLFGYPLSKEELAFWQVTRAQNKIDAPVIKAQGYYFLKTSKNLITRLSREKYSSRKLYIARQASDVLNIIPTIQLVGITGSLAMNSAKENDDIDLMIITCPKTLWITRLLTFLFLKVSRIPVRQKGEKNIKNKLCLNLWLEEGSVSFNGREDIYTAHEVLQTKILLNRNNIWKKTLVKNKWLINFFPYAYEYQLKDNKSHKKSNKKIILLLKVFNTPSYWLQKLYMHKKTGQETVNKNQAYFHPKKWNEYISKLFLARIKKLGLRVPVLDKESAFF